MGGRLKPGRQRRAELEGVALSALSAAAFGTLAVVAKFGFRAGAEPLPLLSVRFAVAAALLWGFQLFRKRSSLPAPGVVARLMLLGGLGYAFEAALYFAALTHSPASEVSLIFYSYPLWTSLLAIGIGLERFRWQLLGALMLGLSGVAVIFSLPQGGLAGPLLALAAAFSVAIYFVLAQVVTRGVDPLEAALWTAGGAALSLAVAGIASGQAFTAAALPAAFGLGAATVIAFVSVYAAIARIGSARTSVAATLEPVTTVVLAAAFLSEAISVRILAGTALIVAALPLLALSNEEAPVEAV